METVNNSSDLVSFGWAYDFILVMLFVVIVVDTIGIVKSIKEGGAEIREYARLCVKYLKLVMLAFAGGYFVYVAASYVQYDTITRAIHGIMGVLLLADAVIGLVFKLKYGRKAGDDDE